MDPRRCAIGVFGSGLARQVCQAAERSTPGQQQLFVFQQFRLRRIPGSEIGRDEKLWNARPRLIAFGNRCANEEVGDEIAAYSILA